MNRKELTRQSIAQATFTRLEKNLPLNVAICPFDLALNLDLEVRFVPHNSFEGIYEKNSAIVIGSKRPLPRQNFTCAHEIGHHVFGHGTKIDEYTHGSDQSKYDDPDEFLAQTFAGHLLMPETLVHNTMNQKKLTAKDLSKKEVYAMSCYFGVGYTTLLTHLTHGCHLMPKKQMEDLKQINLSSIRKDFGIKDATKPLVVLDEGWIGRPVDMEVGALLLCPKDMIFEGNTMIETGSNNEHTCYEAITPGLGRMENGEGNWSAYVRVRRKQFEGRAIYRHMEEVEN